MDPEVLHASFVGFYNRVIPFLWSRLLGDIPRRENPFVKGAREARKLDEIINSQVTTFRYSRLARDFSSTLCCLNFRCLLKKILILILGLRLTQQGR